MSPLSTSELQSTRVCRIQALRGPNIWSRKTSIECWVDFPALATFESDWLESIQAAVPTLDARQTLPDPPFLARLLAQITLALQNRADLLLDFFTVAPTSQSGVFRVVIEYDEEEIARSGFEIARRLLESTLLRAPFDFQKAAEDLHERADDICLGPSTRAMVNAAVACGIPVRRLTEGSLVQLGWGRKQKKILAAATSQTSAIAEDIVQDKDLTRILLHQAGLPVPRGRPVKDADDAWAAALEIGLPVVIKPRAGNQGRAVSLNLFTREQVNAAFDAAQAEEDSVIVEQFAEGDDYRLLVIGKQFIAASRRKPAHVIGNGKNTITELVAIVNQDPRRASDHAAVLSKIRIDNVALAVLMEQGMQPNSVPAKGRQILIRRNANLSTGGTAVDVTDEVHPTIKNACVEAANMVGLDICGLDLVAIDICAPLSDRNGCIIELNARPGLRMHLHPSEGKPRDVGHAVIRTMFKPGEQGRIPVIAITGVNGKTTTTRFAAHLLNQTHWTVGHTSTDGVFVGGRMLDSGDCSGPKSARRVLAYPLTDVAVLEVARGGILREGLAFDRCDIAVVTNIGEGDHLGLNEVHTIEELAFVKGCIVRNVSSTGSAVLNADDPLVVKMAESCPGSVVFFATSPENAILRTHVQNSGKALFVRDGSIWITEGNQETKFIELTDVPLTLGGTISFQIENTLAAMGAVWALGIDHDLIRQGLRSFAPGFDQNAGRFNVIDIRGITVVCDYGHNIDALRALLHSLRHFPNQRRIVVYSSAGDRRDDDIIAQGQMLSTEFDEAWLYEGDYVRGRDSGEIMALLAKGFENAPRTQRVESIIGHLKAVDLAIESAKPGDLLMIQADTADETVQHLQEKYLGGTNTQVAA